MNKVKNPLSFSNSLISNIFSLLFFYLFSLSDELAKFNEKESSNSILALSINSLLLNAKSSKLSSNKIDELLSSSLLSPLLFSYYYLILH